MPAGHDVGGSCDAGLGQVCERCGGQWRLRARCDLRSSGQGGPRARPATTTGPWEGGKGRPGENNTLTAICTLNMGYDGS